MRTTDLPLAPSIDRPAGVAFVNAPFHAYYAPSIALGILKAVLTARGIPATTYELTFELLPYLNDQEPEEAAMIYRFLAEYWAVGLGEWLFSPPASREAEGRYLAWLLPRASKLAPYGAPEAIVDRARARAPEYVDAMARRIVSAGHDIVGFTATYFQTQASVAMARRIKELAPHTRIIVGGASATGVMGKAMLRAFPVIDVVCHTEAEGLIEPLVRALRGESGHRLEDLGGISYRGADGSLVDRSDAPVAVVPMDDIPLPDYDDYFSQGKTFMASVGGKVPVPLELPVETSRGCWWGEKSHCTFCGLNADRMRFRGKTPKGAAESVLALYRKYEFPQLFAVDTIIDHRYFGAFCDTLASASEPIRLSYEVKANLRKAEIAALARAKVRWVQPGLESLSTRVLQKLMKKGTTAIQNVQALKWFDEHGIEVRWNLFPTYPGDRLEDYAHLAELIPRLFHLPPPDYNSLQVQRFSPQHMAPEAHGVRLLGPHEGWRFAFHDVSAEVLWDLTYMFEWEEPARDPAVERFAQETVRPLLDAWKKHRDVAGCTLHVLHGPHESVVVRGPLSTPTRVTVHRGVIATILRAAGAMRSEERLLDDVERGRGELSLELEEEALDRGSFDLFVERWRAANIPFDEPAAAGGPTAELLDGLVAEGLLMRESGKVLTLARNAYNAVFREILAQDSRAFLAFLTVSSSPLPEPPAPRREGRPSLLRVAR